MGRERALIYKTLVLTGRRKGELASLTVAHLHLEDPVPFAALDAADEKNREGNGVALRDDLTADLRDWLADNPRRLQAEALESGGAILAACRPIRHFSMYQGGWSESSTATLLRPASHVG
jgi:integrase